MQENIVLKIKFNDDIRRVRLIERGFVGLQKQIGEIYSIQQGTFSLKYRDDEGDLVTISSEEEFYEAFKFIQNNILRLEITSLLEKKEGEGRSKRRWKGKCHKGNHHRHQHQGQHPFGLLHNLTKNLIGDEGVLNNLINSGLCHVEHNYICDGCESKIRGTRYHCSECTDFDFCSNCYETKLDSHPQHKFVAITAIDALKEAIGNGEQFDSFFEIFQPGKQQQEGSSPCNQHEQEIFDQERHKQQIEQERIEQEEQQRLEQQRLEQEEQQRLEQERLQQEQEQEQQRLEQERLEQEEQQRLEQEKQQEQERIEQEEQQQEQQPEEQQQEPQESKVVEQPQQQPQQPNKTFFENFKDMLFPLRNQEPVNNDTFEKKLEDLTSMGFDKKECIKALVQNKGNIQRAVDALLKKK